VAYVANLAAGTFTLSAQPAGVITCSVQGDKFGGVYRNTPGALVRHLITSYGKAADRFTTADIDETNITAFNAAQAQYVGVYFPERTNVLEACAALASSVGAQMVMNALGKVGLLKLALPAPGTSSSVDSSLMMEQSFSIADRPEIQGSIKVAYCKNWTVQTNLQTGIPEVHKNLFAQEWLTIAVDNAAVNTAHRLSAEAVQIETLLLTLANASAEASRRLALWSTQRTVYSYVGTPPLMLQQLGAPQSITYNRYGLSAGKSGQIVGIKRDWSAGRIELEVLT
jgi:hypothetical protein